jgi:hypothetical protein
LVDDLKLFLSRPKDATLKAADRVILNVLFCNFKEKKTSF